MFKIYELWTVILWYELNPRVRCTIGNVFLSGRLTCKLFFVTYKYHFAWFRSILSLGWLECIYIHFSFPKLQGDSAFILQRKFAANQTKPTKPSLLASNIINLCCTKSSYPDEKSLSSWRTGGCIKAADLILTRITCISYHVEKHQQGTAYNCHQSAAKRKLPGFCIRSAHYYLRQWWIIVRKLFWWNEQFPNKWFHFVDILLLLRQFFIICGNHILPWIKLTLQNISRSFLVCTLFSNYPFLGRSYQTSLKRMFSLLYCLLCISLVLPLVRNLTSLNFKSLLVQGKGKIMDRHGKHF